MLNKLQAGDRKIWEIWQSSTQLNSLMAADEIGLFRVLEKYSMNIQAISKELEIEVRAASAITEYMASLGLIDFNRGKYELNDMSRKFLLPISECYWGHVFESIKRVPLSYDMYIKSLRNNRASVHEGNPLFECVGTDENVARIFSYTMLSRAKNSAKLLEKSETFKNVKYLLDIGGGIGTYSAHLANGNDGLVAKVIDLPMVCKLGKEYLTAEWSSQDVISRVSFESLDFFNDSWPVGSDGIFFSDVFHDWSFETCRELLKKAYVSLPDKGRIFIFEFLKDDDRNNSWLVNSYNMVMMLCTEGQQFTFGELKQLLEQGGFNDVKREPIGDIYTLVSASKV